MAGKMRCIRTRERDSARAGRGTFARSRVLPSAAAGHPTHLPASCARESRFACVLADTRCIKRVRVCVCVCVHMRVRVRLLTVAPS